MKTFASCEAAARIKPKARLCEPWGKTPVISEPRSGDRDLCEKIANRTKLGCQSVREYKVIGSDKTVASKLSVAASRLIRLWCEVPKAHKASPWA